MTTVRRHAEDTAHLRRLGEATEDLAVLASFTEKRPSVKERFAMGKALRDKVPRTDHAHFKKSHARPDPIAILEQQNVNRVQKLVPVRFSRMLASPFAFLRGSAAVMAADLALTPTTGLFVNACGDMHVSNFGVFASAERNLVFAINDFDEVHPGPWEWDLKRLAASAAVAARFMGGDKNKAADAARAIVSSYRKRIRRYAEMGYLEVWYSSIDERSVLDVLSAKARKRAERLVAKAREKGHVQVLDKLTEHVDGEHRIIEEVPLIVRETHLENGMPIDKALDLMLRSYIESLAYDRRKLLSRYRIVDSARKVVGVGSVGTGCWVVLLKGIDNDDPLFLQVKQAQTSVLAPYVESRLPFQNQGRRVVVGQRLTQGAPDIFLGWGEGPNAHFYVRQLADMKGSATFGEGEVEQLETFEEYCGLCGWALALAHAKSGDPAMIAGYCGNSSELDDAIAKFALAYAKQTNEDYDALDKARLSGRIQAAAEFVTRGPERGVEVGFFEGHRLRGDCPEDERGSDDETEALRNSTLIAQARIQPSKATGIFWALRHHGASVAARGPAKGVPLPCIPGKAGGWRSFRTSLELWNESNRFHVVNCLGDPPQRGLRISANFVRVVSKVKSDLGGDFISRAAFEQTLPQKSVIRITRELDL